MDESETRPGVSVYLVSRPRQDRESRHSVWTWTLDFVPGPSFSISFSSENLEINRPLAYNDPHINDATMKKFVVVCLWVTEIT